MDGVSQEKVKEMLSCFLEGHGVLKQFIKNRNNDGDHAGIKSVSEIPGVSVRTINRSFLWASTPEGHDFWSDLNREWTHIWCGYKHSKF